MTEEFEDVWWVDFRQGSFLGTCEAMGCGSSCTPGYAVRVFAGGAAPDSDPEETHHFCANHREKAEACRVEMRLQYPSLNT
ncbi:MAG: hypothetical protein EXR58_05050 [Chloroflexi bacterium]|nr:hypothetical protein [Chloroflexota bacterium]